MLNTVTVELNVTVGVCDIYRNCCFNDVQFDNIEYFAKPQSNTYIVHACISLCGDEGVKQCTHTLACVVMKGLNSARMH